MSEVTEKSDHQPKPGRIVGIIGEFDNVEVLMTAAKKMRDKGFKRWDVYSPFPIHGIDDAMGIKPTILPWIVLGAGVTGFFVGLLLTVVTMSTDTYTPMMPGTEIVGYKFMISGKPFNSLPAWIPVIFEMTILLSAFAAVFGMFLLNRLPMLYNPLFKIDRFVRATDDRFFIGVDSKDSLYKRAETEKLLKDIGASAIEEVVD
ncbi:DUF3341 domain-containing protein [Poriferisphaera corsica]|uniref:DUF3341 domain-containing protein n=1 Tax=Poriferisphaera corsica TaxID=2528020 RepID=UPI0011AA0C2C|nr:DUF3341 domain-containing protein [Poriferisphaera corsica]